MYNSVWYIVQSYSSYDDDGDDDGDDDDDDYTAR
jgi:hypothetical protein